MVEGVIGVFSLCRCRCVFLSYACGVGWVSHLVHDEGGGLGWNWYSPLLHASGILCGLEKVDIMGVCCAELPGGVCACARG